VTVDKQDGLAKLELPPWAQDAELTLKLGLRL